MTRKLMTVGKGYLISRWVEGEKYNLGFFTNKKSATEALFREMWRLIHLYGEYDEYGEGLRDAMSTGMGDAIDKWNEIHNETFQVDAIGIMTLEPTSVEVMGESVDK